MCEESLQNSNSNKVDVLTDVFLNENGSVQNALGNKHNLCKYIQWLSSK